MNTPNWKHIEFNKACICTLLAVLISMFVNVDMYGQYRNGKLIDDYDNRYMQLSYGLKLKNDNKTGYQTYMYLGKCNAGYRLVLMVINENRYADIDTTECQSAIMYGNDGMIQLKRISGKSVYTFQEKKMVFDGSSQLTDPFMLYSYAIVYRIDDIDTFLKQKFTRYSFLDGQLSYNLDSDQKEQRRLCKRLKGYKKYVDLWHERRFRLAGSDDFYERSILLDKSTVE